MNNTKEIDGQLIDWRNKNLQSVPERVGLIDEYSRKTTGKQNLSSILS